jgi:SAM-dependent methyltransferase
MRHPEAWRPTKFVVINGRLRGDDSGTYLSIGSRLIGDMMAERYDIVVRRYARGRLADLGCGNAPLFEVYKDLVDESICVDWPASPHQLRHVDVFADLRLPLPLRDSTFDTVLLFDVLEHVPNPQNLTAEAARILRPGGILLIGVPFLYPIHEEPNDFNRYTGYQLRRLAAISGLTILEMEEVGGSPEVLADIIIKTVAWRPRRLAAVLPEAARWLLNRRFVRRISDRTRSRFPIAYLLVARKSV